MTEKKVMKLASRGKRFGAACIDAVLPFVAYLVFVAVLANNGINAYDPYGLGNAYGYGYGNGYGYGYGFGYENSLNHISGMDAVILSIMSLLIIAYAVVELILFAKGKSIGKALLGLQVVSSKDGKPFGFWKMVFRELFVKGASGSALCLGYIWILVDEKNRGWHDKILDSFVVDLRESEKMNLRRSLEQARRAAAPAPEPVPEEVVEAIQEEQIEALEAIEAEEVSVSEVQADTVINDENTEPVIEVEPEVIITEVSEEEKTGIDE